MSAQAIMDSAPSFTPQLGFTSASGASGGSADTYATMNAPFVVGSGASNGAAMGSSLPLLLIAAGGLAWLLLRKR
ncbi:MAG: hypothetical protein AAFQ73_14965 [Pseudomonadota bacterium]